MQRFYGGADPTMWLRMPVEYLVSMLDWRRRIMAEEQMGAATVAMIPHMQKDDRERWSRSAMRDAQGSQQQAGPTLRGPQENPPSSFAGLPVIVETPVARVAKSDFETDVLKVRGHA